MRYCLSYNAFSQNWKNADEVSIKYSEDKGLVNFMEQLKDKRIVLIVPQHFSESEIKKLIAIKKIYSQYNFVVCLPTYKEDTVTSFRANGIPFYVAEPCFTWEQLNFFAKEGVSDILIGGDLGFSLPKVKKYLIENFPSIHLRAAANLSMSEYNGTDPIKGFFIRPEDVRVYEQYIDTIEFININLEESLYNIYTNNFFVGGLNVLIYRVDEPIDNSIIPKSFAEKRVSCERKCLKGAKCNLCQYIIRLNENKNNE